MSAITWRNIFDKEINIDKHVSDIKEMTNWESYFQELFNSLNKNINVFKRTEYDKSIKYILFDKDTQTHIKNDGNFSWSYDDVNDFIKNISQQNKHKKYIKKNRMGVRKVGLK